MPRTVAEQRAIAHILGTLDDTIELNRRMSQTLEAMARALFKSWFIDFDPVRRNAARARNQPTPQPSPSGRGSIPPSGAAAQYRAGYEFAGLVGIARELRRKQTSAEEIFWELVRNRRFLGLEFRRQHQVGGYIADFYCHEHRLVVELDGGVHAARQEKDHKRDAWLQSRGFTVLRFTNEEVFDDPQSVLARIAAVVEEAALSSPPCLGKGGDENTELSTGSGNEVVLESCAFDHLFPDRLVDSELGPIPEGWEVGTFGDLADHPRRSIQPEQIAPNTPYIALEHMPKRCIALSEWGMSDRLESTKFQFGKGEILFGKLRPYFHKVGVAPIDGVCSTDIVVVTPKGADWFAFVLGVVSSDEFVEYTNAGSTGTKMPRTSWTDMARYELIRPPRSIAALFTRTILPSVERIVAGTHESRTLAALRDALLPKLISGEIRVKDADRFVERAGLC